MTETTAKKTTTKKAPKEMNKVSKQETFTSKSGHKYIFSYPGTFFVQKNVIDVATLPNGTRSDPLYDEAIFQHILEGDYDWAYFDKLVPESVKSDSIQVEDFDGKKVTYDFKFPGFEKFENLVENSTAITGQIVFSEYYKGLMKDVITNDVNFAYWDHHDGYSVVMNQADRFMGQLVYDSEFKEVLDAAKDFLSRMFR
ncbi:hypothetical protein FD12_GL001390 [Lentilactobacillus rapi DSM 19907 = JCM 15042]|uniref:Uncharacterized protein n=3 Tax=Lactobacillaceae TaxID=33958 RepID=A0A0R2FFK8_9LACO|nr:MULTISPECIES: hypothetical protein [Lactobacillaceae]KRL17861.1 hypothetical protein FD12_GL001390 [Lentilactobacillus rapi DSM 19907 = JCM 15042]KRN27331.1 hypothetical protein IV38_GL002151 [Lactobacillus selangorensis]GEP72034.1 hypothetical protein LRA02_09020 [Lentilactobacillus rapi]